VPAAVLGAATIAIAVGDRRDEPTMTPPCVPSQAGRAHQHPVTSHRVLSTGLAQQIRDGRLVERLAPDDAVHIVARQRLVLEQRLGDRGHAVPVLLEHPRRVAVRLVHDPADLLVDDLGGLVGVVLRSAMNISLLSSPVYLMKPSLSLMPQSSTMSRASCVIWAMSCAAPLETSSIAFASAIRPPQRTRIVARSHLSDRSPMRSFSGRLNVAPPAAAARDDRDLVQRVRVLEQRLQHRVPRLVVGDELVLVRLAHPALLGAPELHLVAGLLEVLVLDELLVLQRCADRGLVDDRRQVRAR
jgi:hypothetical protein